MAGRLPFERLALPDALLNNHLRGGRHMLAGWRSMAKHIEVIYTQSLKGPIS
jgi:hypothetical protein